MELAIEKQFELSFKEFGAGIFRFVYFRITDYELAQDLTEETFVRYWKRLKDGTKINNHKALLYFIAKALTIDHYRTKKNRNNVSIVNIDERLLIKIDDFEDAIAQQQELEQVFTQLKKLKKEYQEILLLHYVEDLSIQEIAFIQKKRENALRVLLHRALKELKSKL